MNDKNYVTHREEQGEIHISEEVLSAIAAAAAEEVEGVSGLATHFSSEIAEKLGKKNLGKGVRVTMQGEKACVHMAILMSYGFKINEVGEKVQEAVGLAIESMAGLSVAVVNVSVAGMIFPSKN